MSADNYLYVFEHKGKFYVNMLFASVDYDFDTVLEEVNGVIDDPSGNYGDSTFFGPYPMVAHSLIPNFDKLSDAIRYAGENSTDTEYGYSISSKIRVPSYADLLAEKEARK